MNSSIFISTEEEKEIAKKLSPLRAKVYLESRAFMRGCIAELLDKSPFEITLKAYPGEIPKIPKKDGNISISHTKNDLIVIWHEEKIGIDIEKTDRKFNYQCLAKKYFYKNFDIQDEKNWKKKDILNNWSAIEAAIKWDGGKLSNDLKQWQYIKNEKKILHEKKKLKLKLHQLFYKEWTISIATQSNEFKHNELIICDKETELF